MTALDAILLGFEAELDLERELGNRIVPIDRSLLEPLSSSSADNVTPPATASNRGRLPIVASEAGGDDNRYRVSGT